MDETSKEPNLKQGGRLSRNLWFAYFCVLLSWGLNGYIEIFRYLQRGTLFARLIDGRPYTSDFVLWYNAALLAAQCEKQKINIYDPALQNLGIASLIAPIVPELNFYIQYPPQFFALCRPMAGLGLTNAWFLWCSLSFVLIVAALWWLSRDLGDAKFSRAFFMVGVLASFPAWISFELGQTALYQLPFLIAFWLFLRSKRYFLAGIFSMILLVKLQYIPVIVATGILVGRFKYFTGLLISGSVLAALTVFTVGISNILVYPQALLYGETSDKVSGVSGFEMQNLRGELILLLGHEDKLVHLAAVGFFGISFLFLCAMWFWGYPRLLKVKDRISGFAFEICAAITTLVMLVASPHTHRQEFFCVSIAAIFLWRAFDLQNAASTRLKILRFLLLSFPAASWIFFILNILFVLIKIQPFFLWAVLVLLLTTLELLQLWDRRPHQSDLETPGLGS